MKYIICKNSRLTNSPYQGEPTCTQAGVIGGKIYDDHQEAIFDAAKLSAVNPIGFQVIVYG